jgi:hypothetical protein
LLKLLGGTVSPPSIIRKMFYRAFISAAMTAGVALAGTPDASNALTFHPSNHSFIQLFELQ